MRYHLSLIVGISVLSVFAALARADEKPPKERAFDLGGDVKMHLLLIPAGSFMMGDANDNGNQNEKPVHKVVITKPFYLGKYEVTQRQWKAVMGRNPSTFKGPDNPVENVGWKDSQTFLVNLNRTFASAGVKFSLPTEAQWEYACRAGGTGTFCFGNKEKDLEKYAWFNDNADCKTHPVGQKKPNAWGLFDMHGNVFEWCADRYDASYYRQSPAQDPMGPQCGNSHVLRGGAWGSLATICRTAYRPAISASTVRNCLFGLRVACTLQPAEESTSKNTANSNGDAP